MQIPDSSRLTQLDSQPGAKDPTSTVLLIPGPTDAMIPKGILTALYTRSLFYPLTDNLGKQAHIFPLTFWAD